MPVRTVLLIPSDDIGWADLRAAIGRMRDVRVLGAATDLDHAARLTAGGQPDLVLTAAGAADDAPVPLPVRVRARFPTTRIVVYAAGLTPDEVATCVSAEISW